MCDTKLQMLFHSDIHDPFNKIHAVHTVQDSSSLRKNYYFIPDTN